jgi:hypothetical protein
MAQAAVSSAAYAQQQQTHVQSQQKPHDSEHVNITISKANIDALPRMRRQRSISFTNFTDVAAVVSEHAPDFLDVPTLKTKLQSPGSKTAPRRHTFDNLIELLQIDRTLH